MAEQQVTLEIAGPKTLAEALAIFQADPPVLTKDKAGHQSKYADLVQVNDKVLSRLNALGVIFTSAPNQLDDGKFVLEYELEHVPSGTTKGGRYPLKLAENPQAMGSAITYARRYVLQALTSVAAEDEDDDGQAASGRQTAQRAARPRQQPAAPAEDRPTAQRAQRPAAARPALPGEQPEEEGGGRFAGGPITDAQQRKLHACLREAGIGTRDEGLAYISDVLDKTIASTKDLTKVEAARVIDRLEKFIAQQEPPAGGEGQ